MNYPKYVEIKGKKYKINTDFKIAIKCNEVALDETIGDFERALGIIYLLFGDEGLEDIENHQKLLELAEKYLSCGVELENNETQEPDMDYIEDYDYIKASFRSDYNINLDKEELHWWEFFNLINGLSNSEMGNCCVLNRIRNLRTYDTSQIKDSKEREKIEKAKQQVSLKRNINKGKHFNNKQKDSIDEFYKLTGIDRKE